ncbi:MAG: class I SAM-dependent methyltransferase [Acidobacteriota bacterium]|jgi:ubiquinone/menaquinone biosynthesis C-methylase UbiE|nr:class I SAM-dependent methyltransferase [Acidobacteriota bacterium]
MKKTKPGQVSTSAAEIYEEFFIPALFQEWATKVADEAKISAGQNVLDVACGTGVLTREVSTKVGLEGSVVGLDINEGMLAVAEKQSPDIKWKKGAAESIHFEDESFDAVVSQFGLMFFTDKHLAIKEMFRVLKSGGRLAIAVWRFA